MKKSYSNVFCKSIFLVLGLISVYGFAQTPIPVDSLDVLLSKQSTRDTVRVDLLLKKAYKMVYNNSEKSIKLTNEALAISLRLDYKTGQFKSLLIAGMAHYRKKAYSQALELFYKSLKIANSENDKVFRSMVFANLGNVYADLGKFEEALKHYKFYLETATEINNPIAKMEAFTNIGILQTDKEHLIDAGIEHLKKGLEIAEKQNLKRYVANIKLNLGLGYKRKGDLSNALTYYDQSRILGHKIGDKYIQLLALNNISELNIIQKQWKLAEINANKTLALATELEEIEWQASAWEGLYAVYESRRDMSKALQAYKNYIELNDSLEVINNRDEIIKIEEKYKFDKEKLVLEAQHERELLVSNQEIEHQKFVNQMSFIGASVALSFVFVGFYVVRRRRETQFNLKVADTELKALRAQMNPHFIFNSLNSIGNYMSKNDTQTAQNYLSKFSRLMRQTLENSEKSEIPIEEDLELLKEYLEIEKNRFNQGFEYKFIIDASLDLENSLIPPMILQPFVENCIWHGISKINRKGEIIIEIKKVENMVLYSVDDNGAGRQNGKKHSLGKTSLGTKITENRIEIINKRKATKASLKIIDKPQGTKVEVKLPLETRF